jgi:tRNA (guanosine-2'-O-)-methyltransferase
MRRRTEGVLVGEAIASDHLERPWDDPAQVEDVIATLEPLATEQRRARLAAVLAARLGSVTLVADALHDPHNGAALLRTCDAFGVQRFHAIERNEKLAVAGSVSRGAHKWLDLVRHTDPAAAVEKFARDGFALVATHPDGDLLPDDLARIPKVALVLGNEHEGIDPALAAACTHAVRVPMRGFVESLNVSVTAAILLHAATRGRVGDLSEAERRRLYARWLWLSVPRPEVHVAARRASSG